MTKADEMFEKLGYENLEDKTIGYCMYLYAKGDKRIGFYTDKTFDIYDYYDEFEYVTMQELQAINEKVKELGWNRMTKEQEEAIKMFEDLDIREDKEFIEARETVLNLIQEQQEQIKYHKKQKKYDDEFKSELLDNIRCLNLDKENLKAELEKKDKIINSINDKKLLELLADLEHKRWSSWQEWVHSISTRNSDGSITISKSNVKSWDNLINTDYKHLSELSKESDRKEVRKTLEIIKQYFERRIEEC